VAEHELYALLLRQRVLRQAGQRLEVVLARRTRREHQQHRGVVTAPETVQPAVRHEVEVAGPAGPPRGPVVELHLAAEHVERLGDRAVEVRVGPGLVRPEGPPVETERRPGPVTGGEVLAGAAGAVGDLGLGIVGLTQWFMKGRKLIEDAATRNAGELK